MEYIWSEWWYKLTRRGRFGCWILMLYQAKNQWWRSWRHIGKLAWQNWRNNHIARLPSLYNHILCYFDGYRVCLGIYIYIHITRHLGKSRWETVSQLPPPQWPKAFTKNSSEQALWDINMIRIAIDTSDLSIDRSTKRTNTYLHMYLYIYIFTHNITILFTKEAISIHVLLENLRSGFPAARCLTKAGTPWIQPWKPGNEKIVLNHVIFG